MRPPSTATRSSWPPDYVSVWAWRQKQLTYLRDSEDHLAGALAYYKDHPVDLINHWMDTYDPRNAGGATPAKMPFILFERQAELVEFLLAMIEGQEGGLAEKARDMGATWVCAAVSVYLWRFRHGAAIGWGSRKADLVDRLGDPDSIFEKIRIIIRSLPPEFWPKGFMPETHMGHMRIVNPETGATITGEAGDNIGRGGRKLIYFKDESAHYERPEKIEAALADNTNVQIDISSVAGLGNVFHRRREAGVEWQSGPAIAAKTNVFVMDWSDHPAKDQAWYQKRRAKAEEEGLLHVFAQEVERNYAAAVDGVMIKATWVASAIDAHIKLGLKPTGKRIAGLDVADEGADKNALAVRRGFLLESSDAWADGDTGKTARRAIGHCSTLGDIELQYDCIGVGAGIKSEANRLIEVNEMPKNITIVPWAASSAVQNPDEHLIPGDKETPLNKDFYLNMKSQAWWQLARRFERTHKAVTEGEVYDPDELIAIPSDMEGLSELQKELSQATYSRTAAALKVQVDKNPPGTRSPNRADSLVMAYWPVEGSAYDFFAMAS